LYFQNGHDLHATYSARINLTTALESSDTSDSDDIVLLDHRPPITLPTAVASTSRAFGDQVPILPNAIFPVWVVLQLFVRFSHKYV
jgi:hypothetical protein